MKVLQLGTYEASCGGCTAVYAFTDEKEQDEKEKFHDELQRSDGLPVRDRLIVAGHFNAQLGALQSEIW